MASRPLIIVLGSPVHLADELIAVREGGLRVVSGWTGGVGDVCTGRVTGAEDASAALLALVAGAGLIADVDAPDQLVDRFCDDLRRFGRVEVLTAASPRRPALTHLQREILAALAEGKTLGDAAREAGLPRRTADRRLAEARKVLGVETTAEAVVAFGAMRR